MITTETRYPKLNNNTKGGKLLQVYLMASFLYYRMNRSPLSDEKFDAVCGALLTELDNFEHPHKHLVTREDLMCGTGFAIRTYPRIVMQAAQIWWDEIERSE